MKRWKRTALKILGIAALIFVLIQAWFFGHVWWWKNNDPEMTSFMRIRLAEMRSENPRAQLIHRWASYDAISPSLKRAVVAAEDDHFMTHYGFDWGGIQRAIERNRTRGSTSAGGSTISQQLAKNLFLSPSRSYLRKGQEALITVMIEATWSKRRILEVYLNVVEWGEGIFGAEAATWRYYDTNAAHLNSTQAARLAVILPNPRTYGANFTPQLTRHANSVHQRMKYSRIPD